MTSIFGEITSGAGGVFSTVTCQPSSILTPTLYLIQKIAVGGEAFTIITSEGGKGFTLATSGAGVATSVLGSVYTVVATNSAIVPHAGVQTSLLVSLGSVLVSALLGMMMTLWG